MPSIFSGLDPISSSLSSQDHEELNKLKTEVEKMTISDEEYKEIKSYIFGSSN